MSPKLPVFSNYFRERANLHFPFNKMLQFSKKIFSIIMLQFTTDFSFNNVTIHNRFFSFNNVTIHNRFLLHLYAWRESNRGLRTLTHMQHRWDTPTGSSLDCLLVNVTSASQGLWSVQGDQMSFWENCPNCQYYYIFFSLKKVIHFRLHLRPILRVTSL
jgi:hypothetical protein